MTDGEIIELANVTVKWWAGSPKSQRKGDYFFTVVTSDGELKVRIVRNREDCDLLVGQVDSLIHKQVDLVVRVVPWKTGSQSGVTHILQSITQLA